MKTTKTKVAFYILGTILIVSSLLSMLGIFGDVISNGFDFRNILILILEIGFLYSVYSYFNNSKDKADLEKILNKPAGEIMQQKLPWWLILYFSVMVAVLVYFEIFRGGL